MAVNQKAIKVLNKIFEAGFTDEKEISAMTMDDILSMQGLRLRGIRRRGRTFYPLPAEIISAALMSSS